LQHQGRLHSLDHLRAHMMILGVIFHTSLVYYVTDSGVGWAVRDSQQSTVFNGIIHWIHIFRMPVFFIVAGFFTALLIKRNGKSLLLRDRFQRVMVPLALFWPIMNMLCDEGLYASKLLMQGEAYQWRGLEQSLFNSTTTHHLWFLYFLSIFYFLTVVLIQLSKQFGVFDYFIRNMFIGNKLNRNNLNHKIEKFSTYWKFVPLLFAVPAAICNYSLGEYNVDAPVEWTFKFGIFAFYYCYFLLGMVLFVSKNGLQELMSGTKWYLGFIVLSFVIVNIGYNIEFLRDGKVTGGFTVYGVYAKALSTCSLSLLVFNFYTKFMKFSGPISKYVTDASYWIYLIHFPLTIWISGGLMNVQIGVYSKFLIVVMLTMTASLITYQLFVRSSWLGVLLNGKRLSGRHAVSAPQTA